MENEKINNTIKTIYSVLYNNKDNPNVKEAYEDIKKLAEKRKLI